VASSRTRATANWQAKVGLVACTYKLKAEVASAFREACADAGESQAAVLTRLMQAYMAQDTKREQERAENSLFPAAEPSTGTSQADKVEPKTETTNPTDRPLITVSLIERWVQLNTEERLSAAKIASSQDGLGYSESTIKTKIREFRKGLRPPMDELGAEPWPPIGGERSISAST